MPDGYAFCLVELSGIFSLEEVPYYFQSPFKFPICVLELSILKSRHTVYYIFKSFVLPGNQVYIMVLADIDLLCYSHSIVEGGLLVIS